MLVILFILSFKSLDNGIFLSGLYTKYPHFIMATTILFFIYWPISYLYFLSIEKNKNFSFNKVYLLYFLPFAYYLIKWFPFFIKSGKEKLLFISKNNTQSTIVSVIITYLFILTLFFLIIKSYKKIKEKTKETKAFFIFSVYLASSYILYNIFFLLMYKLQIKIPDIIGFFIYQLMFVMPIFFTYLLFIIKILNFNKKITSRDEALPHPTSNTLPLPKMIPSPSHQINGENKTENQKYKMNRISEEDAKEYLEKIISFVEENESYKDNNFNLTILSNELNIPPAYISQALNSYKKVTFYEFLNKYRIEIAKEMLISEEYQNKTILAIAYESGFNSKATFNNFFKKIVGTTPSKYRKENQINQEL